MSYTLQELREDVRNLMDGGSSLPLTGGDLTGALGISDTTDQLKIYDSDGTDPLDYAYLRMVGLGGAGSTHLQIGHYENGVGDAGGIRIYQFGAAGAYLVPDTDLTGYVGSSSFTWERGYFQALYDEGGTLRFDTSGKLTLANGTQVAPAYGFSGDADTGIFLQAAGDLRVSTGNVLSALFVSSGIRVASGSAATPSLAFHQDTDTGLYRVSANVIGFSTGNHLKMQLSKSSGLHIVGLDPYTTSQAWLTLDSPGGGNYDDQVAGISLGENGYKGSASMHFVYTGDGLGHLGMGVVTDGDTLPMAYRHITLKYNSFQVFIEGSLLYLPNMTTTSTFTQTLRNDTAGSHRVLRYSSSRKLKTDIVAVGQEATATGIPTVAKERQARQATHQADLIKWDNRDDQPKPVDDMLIEDELAEAYVGWLDPQQVIDPQQLLDLEVVSWLPSEEDAAGAHYRNRRSVGLIAEDTALVYPSLVGYDDDAKPTNVNYEGLSMLLLAFTQGQAATVARLDNEITELRELILEGT